MNNWYLIFMVYTVFCISIGFLGGYVPMLILLLKERKKNLNKGVSVHYIKCNDGVTRVVIGEKL
jgi:hypothetical protein